MYSVGIPPARQALGTAQAAAPELSAGFTFPIGTAKKVTAVVSP